MLQDFWLLLTLRVSLVVCLKLDSNADFQDKNVRRQADYPY